MGDTRFRQTGRKSAQGPFRRDEKLRRSKEGEERNLVWRALGPRQQLESLSRRRGESRRQTAKLTETINAPSS